MAERLTYERQSALTPALRVLVVNSYPKGMDREQEIQKGILEGLIREGYIEGLDYELKTFCMDTKVTYTTPEQIEQRAETAITERIENRNYC